MLRKTILISATLLLTLFSCENKNVKVDPIENINKGTIKILCDKDFEYVMKQQEEVYEHLFPGSDIQLEFYSDGEIMDKLLQREAQCAILGRQLSETERKNLQVANNIIPKEHVIAKDAVALIAGKKNKSFDNLNTESLFEMFSKGKNYQLVFPDKESGLVKSISALQNLLAGGNLFALDSINAVSDFVNANDNTIGAISYATISDSDNRDTQEFLKKVKLLKLQIKDTAAQIHTVTASEQDIATGEYPLIRPVNYVLLNPPQRIGMGFVNYLIRNRGAKVFLKAGLIPKVMPERDFIVNTSGIEIKKD